MPIPFPNNWTTAIPQGGKWPEWTLVLFKKNGDPLTSGFSVTCHVKTSLLATTIVKEFTIGTGLRQEGNKVIWDDTADIPIRSYVLDVKVESDDPEEEPEYMETGCITITPTVTT